MHARDVGDEPGVQALAVEQQVDRHDDHEEHRHHPRQRHGAERERSLEMGGDLGRRRQREDLAHHAFQRRVVRGQALIDAVAQRGEVLHQLRELLGERREHDGDQQRGHRAHRQRHQADDGAAPEAAPLQRRHHRMQRDRDQQRDQQQHELRPEAKPCPRDDQREQDLHHRARRQVDVQVDALSVPASPGCPRARPRQLARRPAMAR